MGYWAKSSGTRLFKLKGEIEKFIIRQPPIEEKDDYDSEVELFIELCMAVAVSFGVKKREVVHVYRTTSAFSCAVAREQPEQVVFLVIVSFLFSCCGADRQVLYVLDDCGEGLPVSLLEHVLVDGRKASMIVLAHLVNVNR